MSYDTKCKGCKAQIRMVQTEAGRWMPLDLPARKFVRLIRGVAVIVEGFVSHFETCPNADQFRGRKGR